MRIAIIIFILSCVAFGVLCSKTSVMVGDKMIDKETIRFIEKSIRETAVTPININGVY